MTTPSIVDYIVNAFTPDRQVVWDTALEASGTSTKIRRNPDDSFAEPEAMIDRMDELGIATLLLPTADLNHRAEVNPFEFERVSTRWEDAEKLASRWPGRFCSLAVVDPEHGMAGVRETRARFAEPWVVGCYIHTHSFDRRLDHADFFPYYAACADADLPIAMQVGTSGGLMASECGRPITIDRAALYFPDTRFLLSHLGWPWEEEAIAMAMKFPNVYLGTGALPPRHWSPAVVRFIRGAGRRKVVFGTNFPTVGHRHALGQLAELELDPAVEEALVRDTAHNVFTRLAS
jgi:predicted TIM-barrel fold metal-dependent hydrolase